MIATSNSFVWFRAVVALLLLSAMGGLAQQPQDSAHQQRNFDSRIRYNATFDAPPGLEQSQAIEQLRTTMPGLQAKFDRKNGVTRALLNTTGYLSAPVPGDARTIALNFANQNAAALGLTPGDIAGHEIRNEVFTRVTGSTRVYLRQQCRGLPVYNGQLQVNINRAGRVIGVNNAFTRNCSAAVNTTQPGVSAAEAVSRAAEHLGTRSAGQASVVQSSTDLQQTTILQVDGISQEPVEARLMLLPIRQGENRLVWNFQIHTLDSEHAYDFNVDAVSGKVWTRFDWVAGDSYKVYARPVESPNHTTPSPPSDARTLATNPHDTTASPLAWHDTGSTSYTIMRGNNAHAYEDSDFNNLPPATEPDCGGSLTCDFPIDLTQPPSAYRDAAVTNLFYWNNIVHDIQYQYGFDAPNGNFQVNNFGKGGIGGDDVRAEAQDGSGVNNANFLTPPDGSRPRMQMFIGTNPDPDVDGDFDNMVIVHEYGHGISIRQVGGPSTVSCLNNNQQPGEGISDWLGLVYTGEAGDAGTDKRGVGTYLFGQPPDGDGIRPQPYSTDPTINDYTYESIDGLSIPHGVGSVWAQAMWEVYWALVDQYGFDADLYNATGSAGNQRAMLYHNIGLQNTACSPTFTDVRDGIIQAATDNHSGEDLCLLWEAFANFGLGVDAVSGGSSSTTPTNGFEIPLECQCEPGQIPPVADAGPNQVICLGDSTTIGTEAREGHTYSWTPGDFTVAQPTVSPAATTLYTVTATTDCGSKQDSTTVYVDDGTSIGLTDDFEGDVSGWTATGLWHLTDSSSCASPGYASATHAFYYGQDPTCNYDTGAANKGELTSPLIFGIDSSSSLSFNHFREVESFDGSYDQTQVQILTDGGTKATTVFFLDSTDASARVWEGSGSISLAAFAGEVIQVRFVFDTVDDVENSFTGWFIDDVVVSGSSSCTPGDPPAPTTLTATLGANRSSEIDLEWDDVGEEDGYKIRRCEGTGCDPTNDGVLATVGADVTNYGDSGLNGNTTYEYSVEAFNVFGSSAPVTATATTDPAPAPQNTLRVSDISLQLENVKSERRAHATVTVIDANGGVTAIQGATVSGRWELPTGPEDPPDDDTDAQGQAHFQSSLVRKSLGGQFIFHVLDVQLTDWAFDEAGSVLSACINSDGSSCAGGDPPPPPPDGAQMEVQSVNVTLEQKGPNYSGVATVTIVEAAASAAGDPVADAFVECTWAYNGTMQGTSSGTTDASGQAVLKSGKEKANSGDTFTCTVTSVSKSGFEWAPGTNDSGQATVP